MLRLAFLKSIFPPKRNESKPERKIHQNSVIWRTKNFKKKIKCSWKWTRLSVSLLVQCLKSSPTHSYKSSRGWTPSNVIVVLSSPTHSCFLSTVYSHSKVTYNNSTFKMKLHLQGLPNNSESLEQRKPGKSSVAT